MIIPTTTPITNQPKTIDIPLITIKVMDVPSFMPDVVAEVANGGDLFDIAKKYNVSFAQANQWINSDPVRSGMYQAAFVARSEWFQQRVLRELRDLCFVDISQAYSDTGALLDIKDMPENVRRNIAGVETMEVFDKETGEKTGEVKKLKMWDKGAAVEKAMKHLKLLGTELHVKVSGEVRHTVDSFDLESRIAQLKQRKPMPVIEAVTITSTPGEDI